VTEQTAPAGREEYVRLGGTGRRLGLIDVVAQSIGFMGPVFSIAFLVPLLVGLSSSSGKGGGTAAPLSVLLAAVGVLALGWIVAEYTRKIQAAGSLYDYVSDGLGPRVGAAAGLLYYTGIMVLSMGLLVLIGGSIHDTLLAEFGDGLLPPAIWDLILLAGLMAVLFLGVALSVRAQLTLALISIAVVLVFFLYVIAKVGGENDVVTAFSPGSSPQGWNGVLFGVLYGALLFTGFETSANLAEETEHPRRDIPRAVLFSVLAVAGFYVIGAYATVAGYGFSLDELGRNIGAPLFGLAGPEADGGFGSVALRRLVELVVIFDMIAVLIGTAVAASRGFFAMGRDHRLPKALGTVSGRGTPLVASAFVSAFGLLVIAVTTWWTGLFALPETPHYAAIFYWGSTFGGFALAAIYLLMSVGAVRGLRQSPPAMVYLAAGVGIVITVAAMFGSVYKVSEPIIYAPYAALAVFAVGVVLTWVLPGRAPASTEFSELTPAERGPQRL
jgi:amino acid transporter